MLMPVGTGWEWEGEGEGARESDTVGLTVEENLWGRAGAQI